MKAVVAAFNQEKALVGAFSVIVQPVVEPMDRFAALVLSHYLDIGRRFLLQLGVLGVQDGDEEPLHDVHHGGDGEGGQDPRAREHSGRSEVVLNNGDRCKT